MTTLLQRPRVIAASTAALVMVLVIVLSPDAMRVEAVSQFGSLNAPGDHAFIAGHRGGKDGAPENTMPAFELALGSEAQVIETDLQLSADGVPVIMHDFTLDRTTDGTGPVWNSTWAQISALDAGSWYDPAFAGTRVPSLGELLDLVLPTDKRVILELKGTWTQAQVEPVVGEIRTRGLTARVSLASFDIVSLAAAQRAGSEIQRMVITHDVVGDPAILAATCGAVAIVTSKKFLLAEPAAVERIHDAGLGVLIYTLNSETSWSEAIALGVDGIITDKPLELDRWLATGAG